MPHSAEKNLGRWLRTHRLPDSFPIPPKGQYIPSDKIFFRDGDELSRILDNIQGSPRTMVVFPPGQGATTTLRAVIDSARHGKRLLHLFVVIELASLDEDNFEEAFLTQVRETIFGQLINGYWEQALYGNRRQQLFNILGVEDCDALDDLRFEIEKLSSTDSSMPPPLRDLAKAYDGEEGRLIMLLHQNLNLSTFLIFDFPHSANDTLVSAILRQVKWFDEHGKPDDFPIAALSEAWFLTRSQANFALSVWQRDYNTLVIDPFSEQDVFSILSAHFTPQLGGRSVLLGSVFSQEFVRRAWADGRPLVEMMTLIHKDMLTALDIPFGHVPYLLSPRD
jgi:hypothetical protein